MKELYTITAFSENHIGLLNRITIVFTRRHINIESLTVSATEIKGIHRFTIAVEETKEQVLREYNASLVDVQKEFVIVEKTGHVEDTGKLYEVLKPYGILQFVRSGRISISMQRKELSAYLKELPINEYVKEQYFVKNVDNYLKDLSLFPISIKNLRFRTEAIVL